MICIVGGGKMGSAIAAGLVASDQSQPITVVVRAGSDQSALHDRLPGVNIVNEPVAAAGTIIAVKPKDVAAATRAASDAGAERILSVAAGVTLSALQQAAGSSIPVLRAMPNIGAQVQHSATALCATAPAQEADLVWAENVLTALGIVVRVEESQMDAVTGLSGSGTAYVLLVLESMVDAGVNAGIDVAASRKLAVATLLGAGALAETGEALSSLRSRVTTPGGTTVAGLRVLEQRAVRAAFIDAVAASADRSREIGKSSQ